VRIGSYDCARRNQTRPERKPVLRLRAVESVAESITKSSTVSVGTDASEPLGARASDALGLQTQAAGNYA